jgi:type I restriction enzyme S subunit
MSKGVTHALAAQEPSARYLVGGAAQGERALTRAFDLLGTAPGGVKRLRALILSLAIQGRLVEQELQDDDAFTLIANTQNLKQRLVANGELRPDKCAIGVPGSEAPYSLPSGWAWCRFGAIAINRDGERVPVSSADRERRAKVYDYYGASGVIDQIDGYLFDKTLLLIGEDGANLINRSTPIAFLAHGRYWVNNHAHVIDAISDGVLNYLRVFINAISLEPYVTGTAQPKMNQAKLNSIPVALPPEAEQHRIVARVEELMRLCDALEAKGRLADAQHARLVSTLFDALTRSQSPQELAEHWQRISAHFDLLLDRPEAIDALEQTILQLAVRGLLVPQDPSDEPASELLARIRVEKDQVVVQGKLKRDRRAAGNGCNAHATDLLPRGWARATFPDLCSISSGATPSKANPEFWGGAIPWVSPKDMKVPLISDSLDHVSDAAVSGPLSIVPAGSLLMVVRGMILAHSFPVAETLVPVTINQDMKALNPYVPELLPYLALVCKGMKREILGLVDRSTHGTCKLESPKIFSLQLALPPLAEQHRIVTRVQQLRALCAQLRERLQTARATQSRLAQALVDQAVA